MRSKSLTALATALLLCPVAARADSGAQNCSTSGCHGGAKRNEFITWSKKDFHSRAYATLTTARSQRIAETLKIDDPTQSARCTVCHAPTQPREEGVSCASCHGTPDLWLRTHTRPDYTHAERVQAGMREVRDLNARANACVACHQNVDADILAAGHPELIFELDGQSVAMPKHWREPSSAQAWLIGQTVALREMKWQVDRQPTANLAAQVAGLDWLLKKCGSPESLTTPDQARALMMRLAATSSDFEDAGIAQPIQARRAERLVLALDRLGGGPEIEPLFKLVQSLPDFDSKKFADALRKFQTHN